MINGHDSCHYHRLLGRMLAELATDWSCDGAGSEISTRSAGSRIGLKPATAGSGAGRWIGLRSGGCIAGPPTADRATVRRRRRGAC